MGGGGGLTRLLARRLIKRPVLDVFPSDKGMHLNFHSTVGNTKCPAIEKRLLLKEPIVHRDSRSQCQGLYCGNDGGGMFLRCKGCSVAFFFRTSHMYFHFSLSDSLKFSTPTKLFSFHCVIPEGSHTWNSAVLKIYLCFPSSIMRSGPNVSFSAGSFPIVISPRASGVPLIIREMKSES